MGIRRTGSRRGHEDFEAGKLGCTELVRLIVILVRAIGRRDVDRILQRKHLLGQSLVECGLGFPGKRRGWQMIDANKIIVRRSDKIAQLVALEKQVFHVLADAESDLVHNLLVSRGAHVDTLRGR